MITSGKNRIALEALHQLIIRVKIRTGYKEPYEETFNLLDEIEYLPVLMLDEKDRTQEFEEYLKEICEKYSFMPIWYRYQKGENI